MSDERDSLQKLIEGVYRFQAVLKEIGLGRGALEVRISDMHGHTLGRHLGMTDAQALEMALKSSPTYLDHMIADEKRPANLIAEVCGVKFTRFRA